VIPRTFLSQDSALAEQRRLQADLDRQAAASTQARDEAAAADREAAESASVAEERRCQLAAVMDTLAALQVRELQNHSLQVNSCDFGPLYLSAENARVGPSSLPVLQTTCFMDTGNAECAQHWGSRLFMHTLRKFRACVCCLQAGHPGAAAQRALELTAMLAAQRHTSGTLERRSAVHKCVVVYTTLFAGHIVIVHGVFAIRVTQSVC